LKNIKKTIVVIALVLIIGIMEITNIIPIALLQKNGATTVQAYTHNPNNILNNVYEKDGLTILPFIFDNPFQMIYKSYIIEQFQQAGINIKNQESLGNIIVTGNEIKTNDKTYTILIYGDVDQNGIVNSFDALSIVEHIVYGNNSEIKGICKLAANVENDSDNLDSFDALRIIEFVIGREKKLVLNEPESMSTNKLKPEYKVPEGLTAIKGQTLADVKLPEGFTFAAPLDTPVGDVGTNKFTVIYTPEDTNRYEIVPDIKVLITVTDGTQKEKPIYVVPEGLIAIEGQTLADIELPDGFEFEDSLDTLVGEAGKNKFKVTYTPKDTDKYEIVTGIEIIITVIESSIEETEKITGIEKVSNDSETEISQDIYYENKVATIKSIDDEVMLSKDSNFIYNCDIITNDGNKETAEVNFTKGSKSGEIDVKFYATKAGTYILMPKVSGKKVTGTVKLLAGEEIIVKVNEDLTVTDIKVDGKLLNKDVTDEISITTRVEKVVTPQLEFYHIYEDNKYNKAREVKIENMLNTPVELLNTASCEAYIIDIAICGEDKKTVVEYNIEGETTINPYCISMQGILENSTSCSFDIKVTNTNNDGTKSDITRKVNVSVIAKSRSKSLEVGTSDISLYKNYLGTNKTIKTPNGNYEYYVVNNGDGTEKYRVTLGSDNKVYTIIPVELFDEFGEKIKITKDQISKIYGDHESTVDNKLVVLGNNGTSDINIGRYIDIKEYKMWTVNNSGDTYYESCYNESDEVNAIGIAIKDITELKNLGLKGLRIGYNGLNGTGTSAKVVRKTTNLIGTIIDETNNEEKDPDNSPEEEVKKNILEIGTNGIDLYKTCPTINKTVSAFGTDYNYYVKTNEDGTEKYRVTTENVGGYDKVFTIIPIDLYGESGEKSTITKGNISKQIVDKTDTNKLVVLGNNGTDEINIARYIDIKEYKAVKTNGEIYYKACVDGDEVDAIGITIQNSQSLTVADNINSLRTKGLKGFKICYHVRNGLEMQKESTELISAKIDET